MKFYFRNFHFMREHLKMENKKNILIENQYVYSTYEEIAHHFNSTRYKVFFIF